MVLPASAPDDAPRSHEPAWIERLKVILRLADRGVIVLVDGGRPERLGELVRALAREYPGVEVHGDARRLARASKGGVVVLVPDAAQADWLNLERPVVAHRELRLVLFSDAETSAHLARRAVDFFHWISHRIECPPGAVMPAVRTIRRALCARARGIAWGAGDLEGAFREALPGRALSIVPATLPYEKLVEAARPNGRGWIGFTGAESQFWLRRVLWALAEARRRGRAVLVEPSGSLPGFWPAHGQLLRLVDAVNALEGAGSANAGRLAATLDLEPEAIGLAEELLRGGVEERVIEEAAAEAQDPGAEIARLAIARGIGAGRTAPAMMRAGGKLPAIKVTKRYRKLSVQIEKALRDVTSNLNAFRFLANIAIRIGDPELAEGWARVWLDKKEDQPQTLYFLGMALLSRGYAAQAQEALQSCVTLYERAPDPKSLEYAWTLAGLGRALHARARLAEAEKSLRKSLGLFHKALGANHGNSIGVLVALSDTLVDKGKYDEAEQLLAQATRIHEATQSGDLLVAKINRVGGRLTTLYGNFSEAEAAFRETLALVEKGFGSEHPFHATLLGDLGRALLKQRRFSEAEASLRRAIASAEKFDRRPSWEIQESLSEALIGQGKYALADRLLRKVMTDAERDGEWVEYVGAAFGLGNSSTSRGRFAEAESYYRRALDVGVNLLGKDHAYCSASLHGVARNMLEQGRIAEAEPMLKDVLSIDERVYGRDNPMLSTVLRDLADAAAQQDRLVEAERLSKRSLQLAEQSADPAEVAQTLKRMALIQAGMGRRDAADTARRAIRAFSDWIGVDDSVVSNTEPELQAIVDRANRRG